MTANWTSTAEFRTIKNEQKMMASCRSPLHAEMAVNSTCKPSETCKFFLANLEDVSLSIYRIEFI